MENTQPVQGAKAAKVIRVLTVAPLMALLLLFSVHVMKPESFGKGAAYTACIIFLTLLPVLGYPLQPVLPHFKEKGREGQRNLAIIMAVVGYIAGIVYAFISKATHTVWLIFLTYFLSGVGIVLFNKVVPIRASGHACGVAGPAAIAAYTLGKPAIIVGCIVLGVVYWASLRTKRHTMPQLLAGSFVPIVSFGISLGIVSLL